MLRRQNVWAVLPLVVFAIGVGVLAVLKPTPLNQVVAYGAAVPAVILLALVLVRTVTSRPVQRVIDANPRECIEAYLLPWHLAFHGVQLAVLDPVAYGIARVAVEYYRTHDFPAMLRLVRTTGFARVFGERGAPVLLRVQTPSLEETRTRVEALIEVARQSSPEEVITYLALPLNGVDEALEFMRAGIPAEYATQVTARKKSEVVDLDGLM